MYHKFAPILLPARGLIVMQQISGLQKQLKKEIYQFVLRIKIDLRRINLALTKFVNHLFFKFVSKFFLIIFSLLGRHSSHSGS